MTAPALTALTLLAPPLFAPPAAHAADMRFTPRLAVEEIFTDNVALRDSAHRRSDLVTDLSPGIRIDANGRRAKLKADYAYQYLNYAHGGRNDTGFHRLDADASLELAKDLFAVDGIARISQQNTSLDGVQVSNNYTISNNRTSVRNFSISPYLYHELGSVADWRLRYTHDTAHTDAAAMSASASDQWQFDLGTPQAQPRRLAWGFHYSGLRTRLGAANATRSSTYSADVRYLLTSHFALNASGGHDSYDYLAASGAEDPHGGFYTAGVSWQPTERTRLAASAGQRFYGHTYSLQSSVRSRLTAWSLSYDEAVTNTLSQFTVGNTENTADLLDQLLRTSIPDNAKRQQAIANFMSATGLGSTVTVATNYLTQQIFLQKAWRASLALNGARNRVVVQAFDMLRRPQSSVPPGAVSIGTGNTRQRGLNAVWEWRFGTRTRASLGANYVHSMVDASDAAGSADQHLKTWRAALTRKLSPRTECLLALTHSSQDSNRAGSSYRENALSAYVAMQF